MHRSQIACCDSFTAELAASVSISQVHSVNLQSLLRLYSVNVQLSHSQLSLEEHPGFTRAQQRCTGQAIFMSIAYRKESCGLSLLFY